MPFGSIGTYACKALQAKLIDYYAQNAAEFRTLGSVGLLKWLRSPQNTRGFRQIDVESIPGKKRAIAMLVDNPFCFDVCSLAGVTCETTRVESTNPSQEVVFELTSDPYRVCSDGASGGEPVTLNFDADDLMKYCMDDDTTYITRQIARYNKRFIESLDKRVTEMLVTKVGTTSTGAAEQELNFFNTNSTTNQSNLNAAAIFFLNQTWKNAGNDMQFAMIGGERVNMIAAFKNWQGLNDMGVNLNDINEQIPFIYYDRNFDGVFGNNTDFLQIAPGAAQLVTWNRYRGEKRKEVTNLYTHGTFVDPATGIEVDFRWNYDERCERWVYEPFVHVELAVNIAGGCGIDVPQADLSGVNGIIKVHDCSTVSADCPSV